MCDCESSAPFFAIHLPNSLSNPDPNISGSLVDLSKETTYQPDKTEAVHMTLTFFLKELIGKSVLIRSDNSTVAQYINKQGEQDRPSCAI
jgi:hypothetical protein